MDTRVVVISIIVEKGSATDELNALLHEASEYIIGRMGLPYRKREINIISIVLDAPGDAISSLSGKIGMLPGVTAKALYSKLPDA